MKIETALTSTETPMCDSLADWDWFYRGVPRHSDEALTAEMDGEVMPPRPDLVGEEVRYAHMHGEQTESGYTSWTTNPETARYFAERAAQAANRRARRRHRYGVGDGDSISYEVVILRVQIKSVDERKCFEGRCEEGEWLIEGLVENVVIWNEDEEDA